jgi:hypothetical protein
MRVGDDEGGGRKYDIVTFVVAGVLAAIVLGAIGYGILTSSRVTTALPSMGPAHPASSLSQASTIGSR